MCIFGPKDIKEDVYNVMTKSRELTKYCQESVKPIESKKVSEALDNINSNSSIELITKILINNDQYTFDKLESNFKDTINIYDNQIYSKVIQFIYRYLGI